MEPCPHPATQRCGGLGLGPSASLVAHRAYKLRPHHEARPVGFLWRRRFASPSARPVHKPIRGAARTSANKSGVRGSSRPPRMRPEHGTRAWTEIDMHRLSACGPGFDPIFLCSRGPWARRSRQRGTLRWQRRGSGRTLDVGTCSASSHGRSNARAEADHGLLAVSLPLCVPARVASGAAQVRPWARVSGRSFSGARWAGLLIVHQSRTDSGSSVTKTCGVRGRSATRHKSNYRLLGRACVNGTASFLSGGHSAGRERQPSGGPGVVDCGPAGREGLQHRLQTRGQKWRSCAEPRSALASGQGVVVSTRKKRGGWSSVPPQRD